MDLKIAVLAVQGAFAEHESMLHSLGAEYIELRKAEDVLQPYDGLVLPGGESTVQGKLINELGMFDTLKTQIESGLPVLATCAGMILLADDISNDGRKYFGTLPVTVRRNAYGRQLGSFASENEVSGIGNFPMRFIRAPFVESVRQGVDVIAHATDNIVGVRYQNQTALAFHPEITEDTRIHEDFLNRVKKVRKY